MQTAVEEPRPGADRTALRDWTALVSFPPAFDSAVPNDGGSPSARLKMGRVLIAPIAPDEFLVVGIDAQVSFHRTVHPQTVQTQFLRVAGGSLRGLRLESLAASGTATRRTVDCFSAPPAQYLQRQARNLLNRKPDVRCGCPIAALSLSKGSSIFEMWSQTLLLLRLRTAWATLRSSATRMKLLLFGVLIPGDRFEEDGSAVNGAVDQRGLPLGRGGVAGWSREVAKLLPAWMVAKQAEADADVRVACAFDMVQTHRLRVDHHGAGHAMQHALFQRLRLVVRVRSEVDQHLAVLLAHIVEEEGLRQAA